METRCWAVKQSGESLKVWHQFNISVTIFTPGINIYFYSCHYIKIVISFLAKRMSRCSKASISIAAAPVQLETASFTKKGSFSESGKYICL